ncbi:MAG: peptidoglycan bridge formation glycyltransferase FemA/FemB family protein, partial [Patescibacteria group bacterium]|nr:peptidoglycan bridge formation glycyltransferase FemA/FemB family protein [Patescibacteria group bacterium]
MKFEIKEVEDKEIWENFLLKCQEKTFLDSWNWGEFQKKEGSRISRLGIYKNEELIASALVIKIKAKRGTFLFVPHGPNIKIQNNNLELKTEILKILVRKLRNLAKKEKAIFIRISPIWERNNENIKIFKNLGFKDAPIHIHPETTWELDIFFPEEKILMNMRKTTRYLIKSALKNSDIVIEKSKDIINIEAFDKLYQETASRHKFSPFSLDYLKNEFLAFNSDEQVLIFLGKYKNEIVSSVIIIFWQGIAFYHQGASSLKFSKIPVSYLLQWNAIKEAKARGCKKYNFWGTAPLKKVNDSFKIINKKHPWSGLSLFKMGFGGNEKEYVKTQDLILSPKYYFNYIVERIRKKKR